MPDQAANLFSSGLTLAVSANTLFNIGLTYFTWKLRTSAGQVTRLEDKVERQAREASEKLERQQRDAAERQHELTTKLVDVRMRDFTHDVANVVSDLKAASFVHKEFVAETRESLKHLGERDHAAELKMLREISQMQVEMAKEAATKRDLKEHEASVQRQMKDLRDEFTRQCRE